MIALKVMKYIIYDYCIDTIFRKFSMNFRVGFEYGTKVSVVNIEAGMKFSTIILTVGDDRLVFRNNIIKKIMKIDDGDHDYWQYSVSFNAERVECDTFPAKAGNQRWMTTESGGELQFFI